MCKALAIITAILLTGCSSDGTPEKLNGKTLYTKEECAYIVHHTIGDNTFLEFNKDLSKPECKEEK